MPTGCLLKGLNAGSVPNNRPTGLKNEPCHFEAEKRELCVSFQCTLDRFVCGSNLWGEQNRIRMITLLSQIDSRNARLTQRF